MSGGRVRAQVPNPVSGHQGPGPLQWPTDRAASWTLAYRYSVVDTRARGAIPDPTGIVEKRAKLLRALPTRRVDTMYCIVQYIVWERKAASGGHRR